MSTDLYASRAISLRDSLLRRHGAGSSGFGSYYFGVGMPVPASILAPDFRNRASRLPRCPASSILCFLRAARVGQEKIFAILLISIQHTRLEKRL